MERKPQRSQLQHAAAQVRERPRCCGGGSGGGQEASADERGGRWATLALLALVCRFGAKSKRGMGGLHSVSHHPHHVIF
jgi:hypothetical protein